MPQDQLLNAVFSILTASSQGRNLCINSHILVSQTLQASVLAVGYRASQSAVRNSDEHAQAVASLMHSSHCSIQKFCKNIR